MSKHFDLAIWSSASDDYVEEVIMNLIPKNVNLQFVWVRSKCSYALNSESFERHYVKDLKKVKKMGYDMSRILIVDDTPKKSNRNYGNAIYTNPFEGDLDDKELNLLSKYLYTLKDVENVRLIETRGWKRKFVS